MNCILSNDFREQLSKAENLLDECPSRSVEIFTKALLSAANCMKKVPLRGSRNRHFQPKWFDKECSQKKKKVRGWLTYFGRKKKVRMILINMQASEKSIKPCYRRRKRIERDVALNVLLSSADQEPKEFWGEIRKHRRRQVTANMYK